MIRRKYVSAPEANCNNCYYKPKDLSDIRTIFHCIWEHNCVKPTSRDNMNDPTKYSIFYQINLNNNIKSI